MSNSRNYSSIIDKKKLSMVINNSGLSKADFSESLGHEKSFISLYNQEKYNRMQNSDILLIKNMYGVDITLEESKKEEETKTLDNEELYDIIYSAVHSAIVDSFKELNKTEEDSVF